jgi:hypothetical protein
LFIFAFYSFLAMEIGGAFNAAFLGYSWLGLDTYRQHVITVETGLLFYYYGSNLVSLTWHCAGGDLNRAREAVASLTNKGIAMGTLFWVFHVLAGGEFEPHRPVSAQARNRVLASNTVMALFCLRCVWSLYRRSYRGAAKAVAGAIAVVPAASILAALSATDPVTVHESMGATIDG